jgi:large subunit ribosomal protein L24
MKIRTGDKVKVMSWKKKDRWQEAEVLKVFKDKNKVLLKWINFVTRHIKKQAGNPGQIVKMEKPIDASNVMLVCPYTNKPTKVWFTFIEEKGKKKKFRFSKIALKEGSGKAEKFIIK